MLRKLNQRLSFWFFPLIPKAFVQFSWNWYRRLIKYQRSCGPNFRSWSQGQRSFEVNKLKSGCKNLTKRLSFWFCPLISEVFVQFSWNWYIRLIKYQRSCGPNFRSWSQGQRSFEVNKLKLYFKNFPLISKVFAQISWNWYTRPIKYQRSCGTNSRSWSQGQRSFEVNKLKLYFKNFPLISKVFAQISWNWYTRPIKYQRSCGTNFRSQSQGQRSFEINKLKLCLQKLNL